MLSVGIVGLPNVGKSTLFNALLKKQQAFAANYSFATIEPNVGVIPVPDGRLEKLALLVKAEEKMGTLPPIVPAMIKFVDIAGLVKGASRGEGLGNQFLGHIREVEAIVEVIRNFSDEGVIRAGSTEPSSDIETVNTELILADLQTIQKSKIKMQSDRLKIKNRDEELRLQVVEKLEAGLNRGLLASAVELRGEEQLAVRSLQLLTAKPVIYVYNSDEAKVAELSSRSSPTVIRSVAEGSPGHTGQGADEQRDSSPDVSSRYQNDTDPVYVSAKLEAELSELSQQEQVEYLRQLGIKESSLDKVIKKAYEILGLITFLTAGPKEVRAWTINKGDKAPQAAGKIHTDFERGFIAAEVISTEELLSAGSYKKAKELGQIRLEGKNYEIRDGDVVEFRFSV